MKFKLKGNARLSWQPDHSRRTPDNFSLPAHLSLDLPNVPESLLTQLELVMFRRRARKLLHDASEPLSVIMNLTATLKANPTLDDEGRADLVMLDEQTAYLKTMVEQTRQTLESFSRSPLEGLNVTGEISFLGDG